MSVRLNNDTDVLTCALGSALSIGTGDASMGAWVHHHTDWTVATGQKIVTLADAAAPSSANRFSFGIYNGDATRVSGEYHSSDYVSAGYAYSASTWYFYAITRASGTTRFRVFDDSTSTTPLHDATVADSTNDNDLDTVIIGFLSGIIEGAPVMVTNLKIQTGVAWSDAECRTEARYFGLQKSGGTNRLCWRLKDVDADTDGLYEIGGSGPNFTNSGAVADAAAPTNLGEFSAGTTIYLLNSASGNYGTLQVGGSPPSTATTGTGWTVDTVAASNYARMAYGVERASSNFSGTAQPSSGPDNTLGDCWRSSSTLSGDFATGTWSIAVPVIAVTAAAGQDGRVRVRLWRSTNADGSSATEITAGATAGTTVTDLATGAEQVSTVTTASITGFTMTNEYLFVQVAWEITGAAA